MKKKKKKLSILLKERKRKNTSQLFYGGVIFVWPTEMKLNSFCCYCCFVSQNRISLCDNSSALAVLELIPRPGWLCLASNSQRSIHIQRFKADLTFENQLVWFSMLTEQRGEKITEWGGGSTSRNFTSTLVKVLRDLEREHSLSAKEYWQQSCRAMTLWSGTGQWEFFHSCSREHARGPGPRIRLMQQSTQKE